MVEKAKASPPIPHDPMRFRAVPIGALLGLAGQLCTMVCSGAIPIRALLSLAAGQLRDKECSGALAPEVVRCLGGLGGLDAWGGPQFVM